MLTHLNKEQKQAIEYTSGPLLIVAGAGTGKTTVITQKIAYLIEQKLAKPEEILALTFTEKAAQEMQDRVDDLLDLGYSDMQISTFHAFCQRILEHHGLDIGLPNQFKLLTQTDAWLLVRKNLDKFNLDYYRPLGNPTRHIHELLKHFSKCKDELITPQEYLDYAESVKLDGDNAEFVNKKAKKHENTKTNDDQVTSYKLQVTSDSKRLTEIANAYHTYNQLLLDNNCLDFGDLIFYTIKLLHERPNILKLLQNHYKFILVDEFQDVNFAQYELVRLLANTHFNSFQEGQEDVVSSLNTPLRGGVGGVLASQLTVVGDDDQSIYAFRGASVSNILHFKEDYPNAKEIVLTENYRSGQEILDLAYKSIQNNNPDRLEVKLKIDKSLKSKVIKSIKSEVVYNNFATADEEINYVIKQISDIRANGLVGWKDFAILVRANSHAEAFINTLEKAGIPYDYFASSGLYREPIILDCVNFLKTIDNYHESSAIFRLLHLPFLNFTAHDFQKLTFFAKKKSISLYESLKHAGEAGVSQAGLEKTTNLLNLIAVGMQSAKGNKPTVVLLDFLEKSGYFQYLTKAEESREVMRQIQQLRQFLQQVREYEDNNPQARVAGFVEHYNYILESGDEGQLYQPVDLSDAVRISTIHSAKGLEFKYVFVVNLVEERFPTRRRGEGIELPEALIKEHLPEGDYHIEEERRLFYVACTRAKEKLFLTSAEDYGGQRKRKVSRFIDELQIANFKFQNTNSHSAICNLKSEIDNEKLNVKKKMDDSVTNMIGDSFSYSQINSYQRCPYQYKLAHVLKIPTKGNASFSFGSSIHNTLQKFYNKVIELNSAKQESLFGQSVANTPQAPLEGGVRVPTPDDLLKLYEESWIPDWYDNKQQREDYFAKGKEVLKTFYATQEGKWTIPTTLEGWFKIKVGPALQTSSGEAGRNYFINGRIDRIDKTSEGLEIIDYKTGKAKEKVEGDDKNQLLIYQLAAQTLPEYRNLGVVAQLTFYYLEEGTKLSFVGNEKDLKKMQEKILQTINEISSGNFTATPNQFMCRHCDFRDICEYREI